VRGELLLELALHQHIVLLLKGGGEPLYLLSLLLDLSETCLRVLQRHALTLSTSLRLGKGSVPQRKLAPRLAKHHALLLKHVLLALQHDAELFGLLGLLLRRSAMSVALLLCTMQGVLIQADPRPRLVQRITNALHHRAQVLVFLVHILQLGVQVGDVGNLFPIIPLQSLPREK
jgi:hypothetical protein